MAKTFYYDSGGLLEATINDGTLSSGSFSDGTTMTNEDRLVDQSIATAVTDYGNTDAFKVTFSASTALDFVALYFSAAETDNISFNRAVAPNTYSSVANISTDFVAGWNVTEFSSASSENWILSPTGDVANLTEMITGSKLAFEVQPDVGIGEQEIFGADVQTSIGGVEYATKKHEPKSTFSFNFSNISQTFKNNLQTFEQSVQNYKKFIYSEDGTTGPFHYVRLDSPIQFAEVAFERYSASFTLREQLS